LGQRQELLNQISQLEQLISPAKKRWQEYLGELASDRRAAAESFLAETRRLLEQITSADRDDALVLQQRKLSLGRQISQAGSARQVNRSYATAAYGRRAGTVDLQR
jgi:hypothetical protein